MTIMINMTPMEKLKNVTVLSTKVSSLVHEMQKERGLTAGYIGSSGKKLRNELLLQRENTNQKIKEYKSNLELLNVESYKKEFNDLIKTASNNLNKIENTRSKVISLNIKLKDALSFYTNTNNSFLNIVLEISDFSNDASFSKQINSYSSFLYAKDKTGIERAVGAGTFANDKFNPGMRTKFNALIAQQDAYLNLFLKYSNEKVQNFYKQTVSGDTIKEVERMRNVALNANSIGGFGVDSTFWFDNITAKINKLKKVENFISNDIKIEDIYLKNIVTLAHGLIKLIT